MIDFDDMHLPKDNLDFLCKRYCSREPGFPESVSKKQRNEILHAHLTTLREEHGALRDTVLQSFMDAIKESLNAQDEAGQHEFFWDPAISKVLISSFTRLVQSSLTVLHVQSTNQLPALLRILKFVDEALQVLAKKTNNFRAAMKDTQV